MSWKGTARSITSAINKLERESLRRQRELEKQRQNYERMQAAEQAAYEVQVYENYIDVITSLHKESNEIIDWSIIRSKKIPEKPIKGQINEEKARNELTSYKPTFFDKVFNLIDKKIRKLESAISKGKRLDEEIYNKKYREYEKEFAELSMMIDLADRILSGEGEAYIESIKHIDPFSEISHIGSNIDFAVVSRELLTITLKVNGEEVIPKESKMLLKTGKLSIKKITKTKFYALYQDYVCSAVLRLARETFALLPVSMVIITAEGELLNTSTGYFEEKPILSVAIPKETLSRLNFELLDPSDAMDNFIHRMKFLQTKGFSPIERILPSDVDQK